MANLLHRLGYIRKGHLVSVTRDELVESAALLAFSLSLNPGLPVELVEAALSDTSGTLVLSDLGNAANSGASAGSCSCDGTWRFIVSGCGV